MRKSTNCAKCLYCVQSKIAEYTVYCDCPKFLNGDKTYTIMKEPEYCRCFINRKYAIVNKEENK